jgi:hypothetical protein
LLMLPLEMLSSLKDIWVSFRIVNIQMVVYLDISLEVKLPQDLPAHPLDLMLLTGENQKKL